MSAALGAGVTTSFADTGSVYVDGNRNAGAGHDFFGGGNLDTAIANIGIGYSVLLNLS